MMGFSSLIPVLGTGLVWVPASGYLLIVGKWKAAVFLMLWCGLLVTSIDTFLRPYFMRGASGMPLIYIFLSVIGGLQAFGPPGLLYGPLILSFAMVMLRIYGEEYRDVLMEKEFIGPKPEDSTTTHDD
jgi:predicted PurR-regulated permease PerM